MALLNRIVLSYVLMLIYITAIGSSAWALADLPETKEFKDRCVVNSEKQSHVLQLCIPKSGTSEGIQQESVYFHSPISSIEESKYQIVSLSYDQWFDQYCLYTDNQLIASRKANGIFPFHYFW